MSYEKEASVALISDGDEDSDPLVEVDLNTAIESAGIGRYHAGAMVVACLIWMYMSVVVTAEPFFLKGMTDRLELSSLEAGAVAACRVVGCIFGGLFMGRLADQIGRVKCMSGGIALTACVTLLGGIKSGGFSLLLVSRFGVGLAGAGVLMTNSTLFAEICPAAHRGRFLALMHLFWPAGMVACIWVVPQYGEREWRNLMLVTGGPGFLLAPVVLCVLWESPRTLLMMGEKLKAEAVIRTIAFQNGTSIVEGNEKWMLADPPAPSEGAVEGWHTAFSAPFRWRVTLPLGICFFAINYASQGTFLWLNEYMTRLGFENEDINLEYNLIAVAQVAATLVSIVLIDSGQRRLTLAFSFVLAGVFMLVAVSYPDNHQYVTMFFVIACFWEQFIWLSLYIVAGEVYPSVVRNTCVGILMGPNRLGGVISTAIGRVLMNDDVALPFILHALFLIGGGLAALMLRDDKTRQCLNDQI